MFGHEWVKDMERDEAIKAILECLKNIDATLKRIEKVLEIGLPYS